MKILIVDDEEMMQQVVKEFILAEGQCSDGEIRVAGDGVAGLEEYKSFCPDIVISDMMMPRMGGAEMIAKIRELNAECEFIVMTAYADVEMALSVIRAGAFELLRKPFEPKEINLCIAKISEKLAMRKENHLYRNKLVEAEKFSSLGLLSAGIAHEINNPNTFVKGNLELLLKYVEILRPELERLAGTESELQPKYQLIRDTITDTLKSAISGAERISKIVNGLKTFSRKSTGTTHSVRSADLWEEAITLTSHRLKQHEIIRDIPGDLRPVTVDIQDVVQVFMNLLVNAVDAIEQKSPRGTVKISAHDDLGSKQQVLTIRDSGVGMDESTQQKIFLPFFTTKGQKGNGLGLSISKGAIEAQRGTISVRSKPGEFTEFEIRLPIAA